jgi:hypothetical protein
MPLTLALVDLLAAALGIICKAATLGFVATRGFNPASWRGERKSTVSLLLPKELVFGAQSHFLPNRLNGAINGCHLQNCFHLHSSCLHLLHLYFDSMTSCFLKDHILLFIFIYYLSPSSVFNICFNSGIL